MKDVDDFNDYENEVYDIDNVDQTVKLKPDYYVHLGLNQLTRVFEGEVTEEEGFKKYIHLVHHIEILVRAAKMLPKGYLDNLKKIKDSEEYKGIKSNLERNTYLAREKLNLFIGNVFSQAPANGALYLYENGDKSTSMRRAVYDKMIEAKKKEFNIKEEDLD